MENWKDINGYEGLYKISDEGNVHSFYYNKKLKPKITDGGYAQVTLVKNGTFNYHLIHRLVAINFIENPKNKREVNHKDFDKQNNSINNLEWVTASENQIHSQSRGTIVKRKGSKHEWSKPMLNIQTGIYYDNIIEAAQTTELKACTFYYRAKRNKTNFINV
jgi:hypothetical protein